MVIALYRIIKPRTVLDLNLSIVACGIHDIAKTYPRINESLQLSVVRFIRGIWDDSLTNLALIVKC